MDHAAHTAHAAAAQEGLRTFFLSNEYMPHGHCYAWRPDLVLLHVGSDALIGTAYVVISLTLWELVRRIRLPFTPMILAFGVFIGACGLTHYMEIWTLWIPDYWLSGGVKAITAAASVATGAYLVKLRPVIVRVTQSAQLAEERRIQLEITNRELERLYARVKDLDDAKTRFFANVSHELRTPLALIVGPVEKLLAADPPAEVRDELEVARRNARVLLRHVNDLLDVARLEEGGMALRYATVDLAALVRDVAANFAALARDRGIALEVDAPDRLLPAEIDPEKIERVVANLVGNAFKFAREGGRVRCVLEAGNDRVTLAIDDDGPGVAPEMREAVFERFRQDPGRPGRAGQAGAGLGLAIARDFVTLHGGTIGVEDAPGLGGARLRVELPLRAAASGAALRAPAPVAAPRGVAAAEAAAVAEELEDERTPAGSGAARAPADAPTVLVVEDNPAARRYVADALAGEYRVVTASDGREALEKAEALRPDAVVTDLMMPQGSGDVLVAELRRRPGLADVPAIVLSARADDPIRVKLLEEGAQDYIVKPFLPGELRARVRNTVAMKRSRDVLQRELASRSVDVEALARDLGRRRREAELALDTARVAREQAERASQVKSTFLGMMSHELRTPLTSIQLGVAKVRSGRDGPLTDRQQTSMRRIDTAARRLLSLVESMLEFTRIESGRLVVRLEDVDLRALAAEVVDEALPQAQQKLLALELAPGPALTPVRTDPRLLRLVLVNLIVNAIKYTERGSVRVRVGAEARLHFVEVTDTGPGIPLEQQARAFEPFEQLGGAHIAGVGLGLSLVKGITAALGGSITLRSEVGEGSTFRVELPAEGAGSARGAG